jgi:N-acetylneuraminic acid mutarotase
LFNFFIQAADAIEETRLIQPHDRWENVIPANACAARQEAAMIALNGKLYLLGGRGIKPVEEYDPATNDWKILAAPPMELNHFQPLAVDGRILVCGAMTGAFPKEQSVPNLWWFDPGKNEWSKGVEIPEGRRRGSAGAVWSNGKLYLVCGITNGHWNGFVPWMDSLDLKSGEWTKLPDAPHARDHFQAIWVDGRIVAAGGRTTYGEVNQVFNLTVPQVDVFDLSTKKWTTLAENIPTPRAGCMTITHDGEVIVLGGESAAQEAAHNEVQALSLITGKWKSLPPMNEGRHGTGAVFVGNALYVAAGCGKLGGSPELNTMEKLSWTTAPNTTISISGGDFHINGKPTYAGREWNGHRIEGLLLNSRMVQATFDDLNSETTSRWAYADTKKWDAERNVNEFIAAMPDWKAHGLLAISLNFQGGSPEGYSAGQPWITGGYDADGSLRPEFAGRMKRVLDAADNLGMAVILGYFYFGQDQHLKDEAAVLRATDETTRWILEGGWRNVLVEVNNETDGPYDHEILKPQRVHELIERVRKLELDGHRLLAGTSYGGGTIPGENVVRVSDFLLIHGNGVNDPARIRKMVELTRSVPGYKTMPILFNEDDHENFDEAENNFAAALANRASWGWFDFRRKGESLEQGYQSPPVNWGISSERQRSFFRYLAEVTDCKTP